MRAIDAIDSDLDVERRLLEYEQRNGRGCSSARDIWRHIDHLLDLHLDVRKRSAQTLDERPERGRPPDVRAARCVLRVPEDHLDRAVRAAPHEVQLVGPEPPIGAVHAQFLGEQPLGERDPVARVVVDCRVGDDRVDVDA